MQEFDVISSGSKHFTTFQDNFPCLELHIEQKQCPTPIHSQRRKRAKIAKQWKVRLHCIWRTCCFAHVVLQCQMQFATLLIKLYFETFLWEVKSEKSQLIYIYIHTKPLFTIQSKYFKKWKNIDTTNSHSASSNCRKLPMYQPFMSWPYIPRSWGESVSKEAIAMDVRTAIGDCGANSCCNHRAINPWTCAWLCPGSNIKKRNN